MSDKCQKLTSNISEAKLDAKTKRIEKQLNSRSEVIIRGKTPDIFRENITINFLHAAIKWNETCLVLNNLIIFFLRSLYNGITTIIKIHKYINDHSPISDYLMGIYD
ncbi:unnamed protein product [Meloidogyne enterolobii]|uniref:Uncharacterized protein n=1 Tax=Meloidogyne enterolobii TaxID=390850 RepID=A0ACB0YN76_MELEN